MSLRLLLAVIFLCIPMANSVLSQQNSMSPVVSAVAPVFPRIARLTKTSGKLLVEVHVDRMGVVTDAKALRGNPDSDVSFGMVSERAARQWKFEVANDEINLRRYILTFSYRIVAEKASEEDLVTVFRYPFEIEIRSTSVSPLVIEDPPVYHR